MDNNPMDMAKHFLEKPKAFNAAGIGKVTLVKKTESRVGGMGCVYFEDGNAFKIYHDPDHAVRKKLPQRLAELAKLDHECIIGPRGLVTSLNGEFSGYWMPTVIGEELTRLLTKDYQTTQGIGVPELIKFIEKMREAVLYAHSKGAIMGDPNERNGLFRKVPRKGLFPFILDVDNWGIGNMGPVAVAPHIEDYRTPGKLTELTDWYGMGIVWFWLLALTHPYGGMAPGFDRRDKEHFIKRMKAGVSIFAPGVKNPPAIRDFNEIPQPFLDWCGRVYQHGERSVPPSLLDVPKVAQAAVTMKQTVGPTGAVTLTKLFEKVGDPVLRIFGCGVVLTRSGKLIQISTGKVIYAAQSPSCEVVKDGNHYLIGDYNGDVPNFVCVEAGSGQQMLIENQYAGERVWKRDNRLYIIGNNNVSELKLRVLGQHAILSAARTWPLTTQSVTWLDEIAVQSIGGQSYVWLPFAEGTYTVLRVKELDGLNPVASRAHGKHAIITAQGRGGHSAKVEIKFDSNFGACQVKAESTPYLNLNMTFLDKGMGVNLEDDGELTLYYPFTDKKKSVKDGNIHTGMQLSADGDKIQYLVNGAIWHLKLAP